MRRTFFSLILLTAFVLNSAIFGQVNVTVTPAEKKIAASKRCDDERDGGKHPRGVSRGTSATSHEEGGRCGRKGRESLTNS